MFLFYTIMIRYVQASVYEFAEAGTRVVQVSATDVECVSMSCITYNLESADENSGFVIDTQTGSKEFKFTCNCLCEIS